jgi:hypothetical protein
LFGCCFDDGEKNDNNVNVAVTCVHLHHPPARLPFQLQDESH